MKLEDRDGDGKIDTVTADTTGDGKMDTVVADVTGDGAADVILTENPDLLKESEQEDKQPAAEETSDEAEKSE